MVLRERISTALVLAAGVSSLAFFVSSPQSEVESTPRLPASDEEVLLTLGITQSPLKGRLGADEAADLAESLIASSRRIGGDPRLLGRAQAALQPWWTESRPPARVRLIRATIKQSLHDFVGALDDLNELAASDPTNPNMQLTRSTVLTVLGRYEEARRACEPLSDEVLKVGCSAAPRALLGELTDALESLRTSRARSPGSRLAWLLSLEGELLRWNDDLNQAEVALRSALQLEPTDVYTRLLLAEVLMDGMKAGEVLSLYEGRSLNDAELLAVVLAEQRASGAPTRERLDELALRVRENRRRGETLHQREESRYALKVEGKSLHALELAEKNWSVQREPADARVFLEAAIECKAADRARPVVEWAEQTKLPFLAPLVARVRSP